ncbi:RNA-directed DNA polymerase [Caerostris darwini]|uniref:RNA-directed DNA polymerase n=1 Tax=Caerostris darwini TaxID=1538125 RepID=A0AAV4T2K4_9ARAC|nr:RNA-directed DNA polymerase [Caerostris darwini]
MNQGVLHRRDPYSDTEKAQFVIPSQEMESVLKLNHDSPTEDLATAYECAAKLFEKVSLRYGIPIYNPQVNPVERQSRDLRPRLAILIGDTHDCWSEKLASIRFPLNSSKSDITGHTAAYL